MLKYANGVSDIKERDTYLECDELQEGEYLLFIEIDWQKESAFAGNNFSITCYGVSNIKF